MALTVYCFTRPWDAAWGEGLMGTKVLFFSMLWMIYVDVGPDK